MRRLLCALVVALALLLSPVLAQSIVASAASRRVQSRVEQVLERGSRYLTPESLLLPAKPKLLSAAAAFSDGPSPEAAGSKVGVAAAPAAANTNTAAATTAAATQQVTPEGDVSVAAKEVHIKWAVKQTGTMTVESDDDDAELYLDSQNEAADLLRRTGRLVQQPSAGHTEVGYVEVTPGPREHIEVHEEHETHVHERHEPEQHRLHEEQKHRHPDDNAGPSDISREEPKPEEANLIQRLTQVDWQAVFEAAQREAEAEERAAEAKHQTEAEARKAELKKRIAAAEEERRQADAERQKAEEERQRLIEERHKTHVERKETEAVRERLEQQRQKAEDELQQAEAVKRRTAKEAEAVKERIIEDREKAAAERKHAEAVKERVVEDRHKAAEERQKAEAVRHSAEAERLKQRQAAAAEEAKKKATPSDAQHHHEEHNPPHKQSRDDYNDDETDYRREHDSYDDVHRTKVLIQEKGRSPLRYFPGGGIYSFTSELTCISDNEYYEKLAYKSFPMITPRMTKITVGLCEWTVAEVSPTQVNKNVFLLGNAWATCTFLPIAEKECAKPIVGGLTMTVQALQYQFAQPTGIREPDADDYEGEVAGDAKAKKSGSAGKVGIASATVAKQVTKPAASAVAKGSNVTAKTAATTAAAASTKHGKGKGKYLMDVELQNVFLGLITGAFGPKKAHKYKQGAVQFAFGPPAETGGKSYAIETRLPPVAMGGPSVEELQEGMIQLVPGTYQIVFDQE